MAVAVTDISTSKVKWFRGLMDGIIASEPILSRREKVLFEKNTGIGYRSVDQGAGFPRTQTEKTEKTEIAPDMT